MQSFSSIIGILITLFLAYIAWSNHRLEKAKLQLGLFEQRMEIYESIRLFYFASIMPQAKRNDDQLYEWLIAMSKSAFLFTGETKKFVQTYRDIGLKVLDELKCIKSYQGIDLEKEREARAAYGRLSEQLSECFTNREKAFLVEMKFEALESKSIIGRIEERLKEFGV